MEQGWFSRAITLSTTSALLVCFVVAVLFASSMFYYSPRLIICGLSIALMIPSIVTLTLSSQLKPSRSLCQRGRGKSHLITTCMQPRPRRYLPSS